MTSSFNFQCYLFPEHKKKLNFYFLQWFVGFTEGYQCFVIQKEGQKVRLLFEVVQKDAKLLHKIRTELGFGSVSVDKQGYWKYSVSDKKGIQRLISLFYGNLVLPKRIHQFQVWVEIGKTLGVCSSDFLEKLNTLFRPISVSLETAWVAGFFEAKGCFYANFKAPSHSSNSPQFSQKFYLIQQDFQGEHRVLQEIGWLLDSPACLDKKKQHKVFRLELCSLPSQQILIHYLQRFPFQGNKRIVFFQWWRVFLQRVEKKHLTEKGCKKIQKLCHAINQQTKAELFLKKSLEQGQASSNKPCWSKSEKFDFFN